MKISQEETDKIKYTSYQVEKRFNIKFTYWNYLPYVDSRCHYHLLSIPKKDDLLNTKIDVKDQETFLVSKRTLQNNINELFNLFIVSNSFDERCFELYDSIEDVLNSDCDYLDQVNEWIKKGLVKVYPEFIEGDFKWRYNGFNEILISNKDLGGDFNFSISKLENIIKKVDGSDTMLFILGNNISKNKMFIDSLKLINKQVKEKYLL